MFSRSANMSTMLFFSACIAALLPVSAGLPAPRIIYSAVIHNAQDAAVGCRIGWSTPVNDVLENQKITIEQDKYYTVEEKLFDMDTWEARGIIQRIRCGPLVIRAPFPNVTGVEEKWEFRVESDRIVSVGPIPQSGVFSM